jgi:hypothetical protein
MLKNTLLMCGWLFIAFAFGCGGDGRTASTQAYEDPLPSWNEGHVKQSIIAYVKRVTDPTSKDFIPAADRVAAFDNDGTLWAEHPRVEVLFATYQARKMAVTNPAILNKSAFKALLAQDKSYFVDGGERAIMEVIGSTHAGMTEEEFEAAVNDFFSTAIYPRGNVPVSQAIYQPQMELMNYLRVSGFKTFICTVGAVEFVRGISEHFYGVPKEQVIGTTFKYRFDDSNRVIMREPQIDLLNDKEGKPVGIQQRIGRRPVFACGNEGAGGDIAMLKYSQGVKYPSFQLVINHDDSAREFAYGEKDNATINAATQNGWMIVSMKNDWKQVFPSTKLK